ncbi:MAG TPA: AAA family ATPase [Thermoplasmata archaeon]|nr:AAA family ATPase [Thermoplasmata archaeon]
MQSPPSPVPPIGRVEVWSALLRRRERVRGGGGGLTVLDGTNGVGKSSFFAALTEESARNGFRVFHARAPALENPPPFLVLQEAILRPHVEEISPSRRTPAVPPSPARVTALPSDVGPPLGFLPDAERGRTDLPPLAAHLLSSSEGAGDVRSSRQRLYEGFAEPLFLAARSGPVLLAIDDLQFVDPATIDFLDFLVPKLGERSLWVFATALPSGRLPVELESTVEQWVNAGRAERMTLRPLTEREVPEFARWVDPRREVHPSEVSRWFEATGGIPVLLEQLVRGHEVVFSGSSRAEDERRLSLEPRAVLQEVTEPELKLLSLAAVAGRDVSFPLLIRATGQDEESLAEQVERLVGLGILREKPGEIFEFLREDVRFELYSRLTGPRLRLLHRRVGEATEATGAGDLATIFALARHYYLGRVDPKAVDYNRRAAEFARRAHTAQVAQLHYEQALEAHRRAFPEDLPGELDLVIQIALERDRVGELKRAEQLLRETLARPTVLTAATPDQRALFGLLLGRILADQGRWDEADHAMKETLPSIGAATDPMLKVYGLRLRGEILFYRAEYGEALVHQQEALSAAEATGNPHEVAIQRVRLANVLSMTPGREVESLAHYHEAGETLRELGDNAEAAYAYLCHGVVLSQHGEIEEGLEELVIAAELADRAHDLRRLGWAHFNIADLERLRQRLPEAEKHNQAARELLEGIGDRFGLGQTYLNEGKLHLLAGELDLATRALEQARQLFRDEHLPGDEVEVVMRLAEVDVAGGQLAAAREKIHDLNRRSLPRLRPDLLEDYRGLERKVVEREVEREPTE